DSRLGVTATYNSQAGETITAHTTYITGSNSQIRLLITDGLGAVVGDTVIDISSQNINETAASLEGVINTLNGEMFKDINFLTKDLNNGRRSVIVQNGSIDYSIAISDVSGSSADELGINHAFAASTVSDGLEQDYYRANTIAAENMDITKVADSINTALASYSINTSVTDNGDGTSFISINNNSSNYQVEFLKDYNANSVESELGLNSASILGPNSSWASSINVFDNYYFSIDTENFTLVDLASAWQNEINNEIRSGAGITGVTVNTSGNGLSLIEIMNNSAYKLAFTDDSGSSLDELALAKDVARGSSIISNKVYHDYDVQNIAVGNRNLSSIVSQLNGALQSVLSGDGVESPAAMPFIDYNNGDGTHAVRINNSMESATLYQIAVSDHTGSTATELGIGLQVINRNEVYSNSTLRDLNKSHTLNLSNMNIVEVASTLNNYFSLQGYNVEFLAAATKNELYRLNIVNHSGGPDHRLEILNQTGASMENELSIGGYTLDPGNSISSNQIYHNHVLTTTVNDRRLDQIASRLNYVLNWDLATDGLTNPAGGIFQLDGIAVGERRIRVNNSGSFNTRYEITLKDIQGTTLADLGLNHTVLRGQLDISGISRDYGKIVGVIASGSSIEKVRNSINNWNLNWLVADWYDSASTPGYDGSHHNGRIIINNNDNSAARREVVFQSSAGTNQLFGVSGTSISIYAGGNNRSSSTWQARDRALVRTQYIGVNANGSPIAGSRSDWWWEGDTGSSNDLVDSATELPFQSIYVPDNQSGVELEMGDSFCINTYAHSEGPHDLLTLDTVDGFTGTVYRPNGLSEGGLSGGSFVFNDGVLDNNSSMLLPQMLRTGMGTYTTINHDFDFGEIHTENNAAVYSERYSAGDFNWYAHAFYGDDATYFFAEGGSPTQYFNNVKIWRQEDDNCSLLFTVTGAGSTPVFQIEGKGYNRDGSVNDFGPITMSISGGPVKIGCIQFDDLQFGQGLSKGDRFVINIAARAGDSYHDNPPSHSDVNIAISGNPWSTGGSSMEYRFREGVENSSALNLLGYFVDPLNGGRDNGVWTGNLVLDTSANGFNNNSRVGSNSRAHLEINYQGLAASEAGAGLTGYYFQNLQPDEGPASFLNRIECNPKENRNASLMFEVIESGEHFVVLRGQAHVYDKEGKYSYFYDDYIRLAECNINTVLFNQPGFEGITFSCLEFSNISRWQKGDRFSVSLTANAEGVNSTADELEIFGTSDRREVYPHGWRFNDGVLDKRLTTLRTYQIDFENGEVHDSEIDVSFGQFHGGSARGIEGSKTIPRRIPNTAVFSSSMETGETNLAHRYSRLQDLSAFYTSEGKFLLDTPRQIKLFSNGKEATIDLYATDEIVTLMDRINDAIHCVLGQESVVAAENRSKYTSFAQPSQNEGLAGSMLIKSALAGNSGEITFTGEEGILRALEVTVLSNSTENQYTITAHKETDLNNQIVVSGTEDIILPIAEGLKIKLSPDTGIMQSIYNETTEKFVLESFNNQIEYICLHDKAPYLQAGSNEGQTIKLGLGDVTPIGLELDSLLVVTREQATRAITRIDKASNKISSMRGSLGALENRLQKSINTLSVNIENLTGSEAQIRDTDMANQMMELIKANLSQQTALALISSTIIEPMMVLRLVI
ncbi:MAG: flagellin, partial [Chitinophagales bacterium]